MARKCEVCRGSMDGKRPQAKFCGATCRQRAGRGEKGGSVGHGDGLVGSVERELTEAGRLETVAGQLAIALARQIAAPGTTGISSLSKELRLVMVDALGDGKLTGGAEQDDDPEDEVEKARRAREHKARAAASRA